MDEKKPTPKIESITEEAKEKARSSASSNPLARLNPRSAASNLKSRLKSFFFHPEPSPEQSSTQPSEGLQEGSPATSPGTSQGWKKTATSLPKLGRSLQNTITQNLNKEKIQKAIQDFDPQALQEWVTRAFQKRGAAVYGTLATIILSTYFLAGLTSLVVEDFIPEPPVARSFRRGDADRRKTLADYGVIAGRNLFNSQGIIPGEQTDENGSSLPDMNAPAVKSTLAFNLIGTVIMEDPETSIATIEDKPANQVYPVRIEDEIPDKAKILKIEPRRVTFINKLSGRREYIELPEDPHYQNPRVTLGKPSGNIEKISATQFNVSRTEVDHALADFNNILTQARAVPNFENGLPVGYKLFQIVPGSIYDKLGLQNGDVISGLNGESINDPSKAFEMLNELKKSNHLELQVKKDGKQLTYTYDIR